MLTRIVLLTGIVLIVRPVTFPHIEFSVILPPTANNSYLAQSRAYSPRSQSRTRGGTTCRDLPPLGILGPSSIYIQLYLQVHTSWSLYGMVQKADSRS